LAVEGAVVASQDLVVRLRAAPLRELEARADLDALHRLDAHQRRREARVEPVLLRRVRPQPRRDADRADLDHAADSVALGARLVAAVAPPRRPLPRPSAGAPPPPPGHGPRPRPPPAPPPPRPPPRPRRPSAARWPARARRARRRARTSATLRGRRGRAEAAS